MRVIAAYYQNRKLKKKWHGGRSKRKALDLRLEKGILENKRDLIRGNKGLGWK